MVARCELLVRCILFVRLWFTYRLLTRSAAAMHVTLGRMVTWDVARSKLHYYTCCLYHAAWVHALSVSRCMDTCSVCITLHGYMLCLCHAVGYNCDVNSKPTATSLLVQPAPYILDKLFYCGWRCACFYWEVMTLMLMLQKTEYHVTGPG